MRSLLRQIVPDAAGKGPVRIFAGEFPGVRTGLRVRRSVGVAFEGDGGYADDRTLREPLFQIVVLRFAFGQSEPEPIIVDDDGDVVRVVERSRGAIERGVVEVPLRRGKPPDELRKVAPVLVVPDPAVQRSGHRIAMMSAVRPPQSKPPMVAFSILSASISAITSTATAEGWPFRSVCPERNRVEP